MQQKSQAMSSFYSDPESPECSFFQALHFFIGFGALVSPLIADPFLSESGCGNHTGNSTEMLHHFRSLLRNSPIAQHNISDSHSPGEPGEEDSNVHYAFWIMALINVRQGAFFVATFIPFLQQQSQ